MTKNALSKYFRKPAIYIKLPSAGKFNPEIPQTVLDEVGVRPMTAIDEITMKNPDALLNGEALISVIESCVPDIPNPRALPNIDAEALYLAIQYATYGKELIHTHECEKCKEKNDFNIDINYILNKFPELDDIEPILYEDLKIYIKPSTIESITRLSLIELEQKKVIANVSSNAGDKDINPEDESRLAKTLYSSFKKIASLNIDLLGNVIDKVETPDGVVTDYDNIVEFLYNVPSSVVDNISASARKISKRPKETSEFEFVCPECEHKQKVALEVNPVNFFKTG